MRRFRDTEAWKLIRTALEILLIAAIIYGIVQAYTALGFADAKADAFGDVTEAYVLCVDYVNVRPFPNRKGEPLGRFESGWKIFLDGKRKNGFLHIIDTGLESDGWIYAGYVVYDEPIYVYQNATIVSKARLRARKCVNGRRSRWLKPQATLKVYWWSDEWCVTDCGYVKTKYLELEGE